MELLGNLSKQNARGGGGSWYVVAQSCASTPATLSDMSGFWKKKEL